jgi:histidinol dehydrogenase
MDTVRALCDDVRDRGAEAVLDLTERFDGVRPAGLRVPAEALHRAVDELDPRVRVAVDETIRRVRAVHRAQLRDSVRTEVAPGGFVTQRWVPVNRVGLYVPGGLAVYPSSVVMNVVPAQEAGVGSLAVASPPQRDNPEGFSGLPNPTTLATCALLEVDEVYAVGGAQAIAMFAHGAGDPGQGGCEPVDVVTGPGNVWVAAAKRHVEGIVGIDSEAGPTEVMILADDTASPRYLAADLVSQAEHDPLAGAVLVSTSADLLAAVRVELDGQVAATKHVERVRASLGGQQSALILVDDLDAAVVVADAYAAEHLEIHTRNAGSIAARIRNAGAIFIGPWTPVSLGDYMAGSNHVLPTGGTARHASGLGVHSFLRAVQVIGYDRAALAHAADQVLALAEAEDLPAHGDAIRARLEE